MDKLTSMNDKVKQQMSELFNVPVEIFEDTVIEEMIFERYTNQDAQVNSTVRVVLRNGELIEKQMKLDDGFNNEFNEFE